MNVPSPGERGLFLVRVFLAVVVAILAADWAHSLFAGLLISLGAKP